MSVTRVPIQPIAKGSLTKLWGGVVLAVALAGGIAYAGTSHMPMSAASFLADNANQEGVITTESGLQYKELVKGQGPSPTLADVALIGYEGRFQNGEIFDKNERTPLPVGGAVPGFSEALQLMQRGGKYRVWISPELGYGSEDITNPQTGEVNIPGNSLLEFDVELIEFIPEAQLRAMQQQMQGGGVPPGGPPPGAPPLPQ